MTSIVSLSHVIFINGVINMDKTIKWLLSVAGGTFAAFFGQYGLFFALVAAVVVLDVVTGLVKAKATGEGLSSKKARQGFWRKISLFVGLTFGIFLDYASAAVLVHAGVTFGADMPFALIVCAYIIINEAISVAENLYLTDPESFPKSVGKMLKVGKRQIDLSEDQAKDDNI